MSTPLELKAATRWAGRVRLVAAALVEELVRQCSKLRLTEHLFVGAVCIASILKRREFSR